jgi:hypothetical protein
VSFNSLRTKQPHVESPATRHGLKPGDFALGSAESRAAARAIIHRLAEKDGPQPGDVSIDLGLLPPGQLAEFYRLILSSETNETDNRIPGRPKMWFNFPEEFNPDSLPDRTPLTMDMVTEELLNDILRCYRESFRRAKQGGVVLPPDLDPDLVWNGMTYVPAEKTGKQPFSR